ncbi:putative nucleotidyltransferase with HDIG domain [Desulfohalotomaculum tongense]|uniref:HD domain-containing phosphohydrolase n=1 Tax=Desulforadius tongensis TaxID=1216062 RepID=UPI001956DE02|nr:putative nucleotidyltransferase with HDIG domain [Desulforadius tongensis]
MIKTFRCNTKNIADEIINYTKGWEQLYNELKKSNAELLEQNEILKRKLNDVTFLYEIFTQLIKSGDFKGTIKSILDMAMEITGSEVGCIFLYDRKNNNMELMLSRGKLVDRVISFVSDNFKIIDVLPLDYCLNLSSESDYLLSSLRSVDPFIRSMLVVPLSYADEIIGVVVLMHRHHGEDEHGIEYSPNQCKTVIKFARDASLILNNARLNIEYGRKDVYMKTISALVSAIDAKDAYTHNHSENVARVSVALAKELKVSPAEIVNIRYGALLHDVGKIGIPEKILNKTGRLNDEEFALIKTHPLIGSKILSPIDFLGRALNVVRYHHERYDGGGYPEGLKGEDIPFEARIACIADAWDAMRSHRAYRRALSFNAAVLEMEKGAGTQFDPYMVKKFIRLVNKSA